MANRLQEKSAQIDKGLIDNEDAYLNAEIALRNWGAWQKSIPDPCPASTPKSQSIFYHVRQDYADEEPECRIDPVIEEAELTEGLILLANSRRDIDIFVCVFIKELPRDLTITAMRRMGYRINRTSYNSMLNSALAKLETAIGIYWDIPSETVKPNRSADDYKLQREYINRVAGR